MNKLDKGFVSIIPEPSLKRLPIYYQYLLSKKSDTCDTISCTDIGKELGLTPIQVRKDLQYAGAQGRPKIGYSVKDLVKTIGKMLGYYNINEAFIVGAGNFGQLLLNYDGFTEYGFKILAAFDNDLKKIGKKINGIEVFTINKFSDLAKRMKIKIGIIAVNAKNAQEIANMMIDSGIEALWNLTDANLELPENIILEEVNLATSLSVLLSKLTNKYEN